MFNDLFIVCSYCPVDTAAEDGGEGWRAIKSV